MLRAVVVKKGGRWIKANSHFWAWKLLIIALLGDVNSWDLGCMFWTPYSYLEKSLLVEPSGRLLHGLPGDCNEVIAAEGEAENLSTDLQRDFSIARALQWTSHCCHYWTLWAPTATTSRLSLSRELRTLTACPCGCESPGPYQIPAPR